MLIPVLIVPLLSSCNEYNGFCRLHTYSVSLNCAYFKNNKTISELLYGGYILRDEVKEMVYEPNLILGDAFRYGVWGPRGVRDPDGSYWPRSYSDIDTDLVFFEYVKTTVIEFDLTQNTIDQLRESYKFEYPCVVDYNENTWVYLWEYTGSTIYLAVDCRQEKIKENDENADHSKIAISAIYSYNPRP